MANKRGEERILGHKVVAFDDSGKAFYRYTIVVDDADVFGMGDSVGPSYTGNMAVNQYAGQLVDLAHLRSIYPRGDVKTGFKRVPVAGLPKNVKEAIADRVRGWGPLASEGRSVKMGTVGAPSQLAEGSFPSRAVPMSEIESCPTHRLDPKHYLPRHHTEDD